MKDPYSASSNPQSSIVKWSASDGDVIKLPVGDVVYDRDTLMCIRIKNKRHDREDNADVEDETQIICQLK
jgi:hypothetical protein